MNVEKYARHVSRQDRYLKIALVLLPAMYYTYAIEDLDFSLLFFAEPQGWAFDLIPGDAAGRALTTGGLLLALIATAIAGTRNSLKARAARLEPSES